MAFVCFGQKPNWQNLDFRQDSTMGISTEIAYNKLLKGKKATTVVVAVIDAGIDTLHEDLRAVLWQNPKEKRNGKDDDKNGYVDDINGWSFIGSAKGNIHYDNTELVREVKKGMNYFGSDSTKIEADKIDKFRLFNKQKALLDKQINEASKALKEMQGFVKIVDDIFDNIASKKPNVDDFLAYDPKNQAEQYVLIKIVSDLQKKIDFDTFREQLRENIAHYQDELKYHLNIDFDPRSIVGDDYSNTYQNYYGSNDVDGPESDHGTHVAGIIGGLRDNHIGIRGVADHVSIMAIRTIPIGDERDKDVANAIRYAVDNGAKIINMSFGKNYSPEKGAVDEAVKHAMENDVLIVHAAGNDGKDLDTEDNFPNRLYGDKTGAAKAWLEVGASSFKNDQSLKAAFSNFGKTSVDVFAPGVKINSSIPGNKYKEFDGTSMAAPVVTGLAALIRTYYPKLSALQVKEIIMKTVVKIDHNVNVNIKGMIKSVPFSALCVTGGIVNAYNALILASEY